jgi:RecJ-like exonuclease
MNGNGEVKRCVLCGSSLDAKVKLLVCDACDKKHEIVLELDPLAGYEDVLLNRNYLGRVKRIHDIGYFIALNDSVVGLLRKRDAKREYSLNEEVVVKAKRLNLNEGKLDLLPWEGKNYTLIPLKKSLKLWKIADIGMGEVGQALRIRGIVAKVQRTSGPTIFTVYDESDAIECVAFAKGERAYPSIDVDSVVEVRGEVVFRLDRVQVEVKDMEKLYGAELTQVKAAIDKAIEAKAEPAKLEPLVKSDVLERLYPKMREVARELRRAVFTGVPIVLRHHGDTDGFVAAVAIEQALLPLLREHSPDKEAEWHLFRRSPSRAPFYEMEDVVRDLQYAHEDARRFGQRMPLVVILDNGSTYEDMPAIRKFKIYGSKVIVVDHHYPGEVRDGRAEVDELVDIHVNPYLAEGDYSLTAGCLGVEIARLINPELSDKLRHLAGIACVADRVKGDVAEAYIALAQEKGYSVEDMELIAECVDFEAFYLRFMDGKTLIEDLLGLGRLDRQRRLLEAIGEEASKAKEVQLRAVLANAKSARLPNGIMLHTLDLELYSHKFTYPPPGKTTGLLHDAKAQENEGKRTVTLGYGPDFAILRATDDVAAEFKLNLNHLVAELAEELPGAGVTGGGHEVAGSIKFVEGYRKAVLEKLAEKIAKLRAE